MAAAKLLFCILCAAFIGSSWMPDRNLLVSPSFKTVFRSPQSERRDLIIALAIKEMGVRELTGRNDGKRVEAYLHCVGLKKGNPWCAAVVSFIFKQAGYAAPRTGWSPDLFPAKRLVKEAMPGDVFGIYFPSLRRIGHCGILKQMHGDWYVGIEGNTNPAGSREGDGVYVRMRHKRSIRKFSNWIDQ